MAVASRTAAHFLGNYFEEDRQPFQIYSLGSPRRIEKARRRTCILPTTPVFRMVQLDPFLLWCRLR